MHRVVQQHYYSYLTTIKISLNNRLYSVNINYFNEAFSWFAQVINVLNRWCTTGVKIFWFLTDFVVITTKYGVLDIILDYSHILDTYLLIIYCRRRSTNYSCVSHISYAILWKWKKIQGLLIIRSSDNPFSLFHILSSVLCNERLI
jgi:hypothetical protein